jgi:hypothetical protein
VLRRHRPVLRRTPRRRDRGRWPAGLGEPSGVAVADPELPGDVLLELPGRTHPGVRIFTAVRGLPAPGDDPTPAGVEQQRLQVPQPGVGGLHDPHGRRELVLGQLIGRHRDQPVDRGTQQPRPAELVGQPGQGLAAALTHDGRSRSLVVWGHPVGSGVC